MTYDVFSGTLNPTHFTSATPINHVIAVPGKNKACNIAVLLLPSCLKQHQNPEWFVFPVLTYPGCPGKEVVK